MVQTGELLRTIYEYLDHLEYLKDFLSESKISKREFGRRAGFSSPSYLKSVQDGKLNISDAMLSKFARALELEQQEKDYFFNLVRYNQAKDAETREHYYLQMSEVSPYLDKSLLGKEQYDYLSDWHHAAIRELVAMKSFQEDPHWIVTKLNNKISVRQATYSLKLLESLGLLRRDRKSRLFQAHVAVRTPPEVFEMAAIQFHKSSLDHAKRSIEEIPGNKRELSGTVIGMSQKQFKEIKAEILKFRRRIIEKMSSESQPVETVYQLNFQFLPLISDDD